MAAHVFKFLKLFAPRPRTEREALVADLRAKRYAQALSRIDAMPALSGPDRAFLLNKRGVALAGLGQRDRAEAAFLAALDVQPRYAAALTNLGNIDYERGRLAEALAHFDAAIRADEAYAGAYFNKAVVLRALGRIDESVRARRKAQRLEGRLLGKQREPL